MPEPGPGAASRAARVGRSWVVVALVAFCALAWRLDFVCDDAYISFRYAKRFAAGEGLSFNPGRVPPVEGYSNFLWVVWLSVFERLGVDIALAARATSGLCTALLVLLFARQLEHGRTRGPLGLLAFATLPPITLWATGGLASAPLHALDTAQVGPRRLQHPSGVVHSDHGDPEPCQLTGKDPGAGTDVGDPSTDIGTDILMLTK